MSMSAASWTGVGAGVRADVGAGVGDVVAEATADGDVDGAPAPVQAARVTNATVTTNRTRGISGLQVAGSTCRT
jgi:hypothetical protein